MPKKPAKPNADKPARQNVSLAEEWHALARRLAAMNRQPIGYLFVDLLLREAKEKGITDLPSPPWEKSADE